MAFYLNQPAQDRSWGPFESEARAWRFLFGRESTEQERQLQKDADWSVTDAPMCSEVRS